MWKSTISETIGKDKREIPKWLSYGTDSGQKSCFQAILFKDRSVN